MAPKEIMPIRFADERRKRIAWRGAVLFLIPRARFSDATLADLACAMLRHRLRSETVPLPALPARGEARCSGDCADCKKKTSEIAIA